MCTRIFIKYSLTLTTNHFPGQGLGSGIMALLKNMYYKYSFIFLHLAVKTDQFKGIDKPIYSLCL